MSTLHPVRDGVQFRQLFASVRCSRMVRGVVSDLMVWHGIAWGVMEIRASAVVLRQVVGLGQRSSCVPYFHEGLVFELIV